MDFELRQVSRKRMKGVAGCLWASEMVAETAVSGELQAEGRQRGHTGSGGLRGRAAVVMRKIVSWAWRDEYRRRPQSKLSGGETFDQNHRPAALGTGPERR